MLHLSPRAIARQLRAGQLAGYHEQRTFYDPASRRWLRRRWWMIPGPALFAFMDARADYEAEHQLRPYTRNASGARPESK